VNSLFHLTFRLIMPAWFRSDESGLLFTRYSDYVCRWGGQI